MSSREKNIFDRLSASEKGMASDVHHESSKGCKSNMMTVHGANDLNLNGMLHTTVSIHALKLKDSIKVIGDEAIDTLLDSLKAM